MDASAIQTIQDTAIAAAKANRLDLKVPAILVPSGMQLMKLEGLLGERAYFRGRFTTHVLDEFATYVQDHPGGVGFIDDEAPAATVFHNLGDETAPGAADWTSCLQLRETAGYAAVQRVTDRALTQKQLVEWIEDWAPSLFTIPAGAGPADQLPNPNGLRASIRDALHAIRTLNIKEIRDSTHTDKDYGATRSVLEEIDASARGAMPYGLAVRVTPYLGFALRDLTLRLSVITGDTPALKLRIVGAEQLAEDIADEFRGLLLNAVGHAASMTIGTFAP